MVQSLADGSTGLDRAMDRYARGDEGAFAEVHAGLRPRLWAFLARVTGSSLLAEELVAETFLRIHRARGTFGAGAAVVPWAYAIARNTWLDHLRSQRTDARTAEREDRALEPPAGPEADPEQALLVQETARIVERTLPALPRSQREAFVLLRYEGLSLREAATVLGCTQMAVKLRASRAYAALRRALAGILETGPYV